MNFTFFKKYTHQQKERGFSIIEIMIGLGIIAIIATILISNYPRIRDQYALSRVTYKFGQDIRRAQDLALASFQYKDTAGVTHLVYGYGVTFDILANSKKYMLYADAQAPGQLGNGKYNVGDYIIDTIDFTVTEPGTGVYIALIYNTNSNNVSINFRTPNPGITISTLNAGQNSVKVIFGLLGDSTKTRIVSVNTSGLIDVSSLQSSVSPAPSPDPSPSPTPTPTPPPTPSPESLDFPGWTTPPPGPSPSPSPTPDPSPSPSPDPSPSPGPSPSPSPDPSPSPSPDPPPA